MNQKDSQYDGSRKATSNGVAAFVALILLTPCQGIAWGTEGHRAIAELATARLTPAPAKGVRALLGSETMADVSTWADDVRRTTYPQTYRWHFVDIPLSAEAYDESRDCRHTDRGDCIIAALVRLEAELANPTALPEGRREALMFVIHLVGDLHQPLHVSDNNDAGGNGRAIAAIGGSDNLHSAWDSGIIRAHNRRVEDLTAAANRWLGGQNEAVLSGGRYVDWAMESFIIAKNVAYREVGSDGVIGDNSSTAALQAIEVQLAKAGVRLAAVLNRALPACLSCR